MASTSDKLRAVVVTPEETVLETDAEFVALPLYDGELGVARGHAPMIGRLGYGELRIRSGGEVTQLYVDGGFVQVADNVVSVLTNRALPPKQLDVDALEREMAAVQKASAGGDEAILQRTTAIEQLRGQLRVAKRAAQR